MLWLSIVSLAVGVLLARHFKVMVLVPATIVVVVAAAGAGLAQIKDVWSTLLIIGAASIGLQTGYFAGMLLQRRFDSSWCAGHLPFLTSRRHKIPRIDLR